jgi:hypothetical protein
VKLGLVDFSRDRSAFISRGNGQCHVIDGLSLKFYFKDTALLPGKSMWYLWWTKWH